jgi:hypothetical protein
MPWFSLLSAVARPAPTSACRWRSVRACSVLVGAGANAGQARDFVFVGVAPCPCGQPLAYAVPLVCCGLHGIHAPWDSAPMPVDGVWLGGWYAACGGGWPETPVMGPTGEATAVGDRAGRRGGALENSGVSEWE